MGNLNDKQDTVLKDKLIDLLNNNYPRPDAMECTRILNEVQLAFILELNDNLDSL